jgi:hypothetical protein
LFFENFVSVANRTLSVAARCDTNALRALELPSRLGGAEESSAGAPVAHDHMIAK